MYSYGIYNFSVSLPQNDKESWGLYISELYHIFFNWGSMNKIRIASIILFFAISAFINAETKRALLIGISDYPFNKTSAQTWHSIHGANDVAILSNTIKRHGFNVKTLTNKNATAKNIRTALNKLVSGSKSGDIIYIHFSGHGQPVEDIDGDETDGWDEAIIPYDAHKTYIKGIYEGNNHILDDELNTILKAIRTKIGSNGYIAVAIDACHAGSSYRGEEDEDSVIIRGTNIGFSATNKPFVPLIDKRSKIKIEQSSTMSPICLIEACRSYQVNCEIKENGKHYGSLSFYLNKVLQKMSLQIDNSWADTVSTLMSKDRRLLKQNVVIETSE